MIPLTLSRLLHGSRSADHPIADRNGAIVAFTQFRADVAGVAARVRSLGHRRAALLCRDGYAFAVGLFALLHENVDIVLPPNGQGGTLAVLRDAFDVLIDDDFIAGCEARSPDLKAFDPERPKLVFFTSGSTGIPKRIAKSLGVFEREAMALESVWGRFPGNSPVLAMVPHQHVYGLTFKLMWPLAAGRPFAAETVDMWEPLLAAMKPGAIVVSSPAHLSRCGGLSPLPIGCRPIAIFSAGAPLPLASAAEAEAVFGVRPTEIFGSTETGAFATRRQQSGTEPWTLLPGISMRCDADGRLSLLSSSIGESWFETADLVVPDGDGFHYRGRADRIVKIEGNRVSLTEIEDAISALPCIAAAAVVILPGEPERLGAAVTLKPQGRERLAEAGPFRFGRQLRSVLSDRYEPAALPRVWRFVDALPTGALGKHRDADIRALFVDRQL
jgi:acyl-coenzyme A synthetase/AMP-(fatty) acid ligase